MAIASSLHYKKDIFLFPSRHSLVYFLKIILFIWCHGDTFTQAGSIQLHVERKTSPKQFYHSPSFVLWQRVTMSMSFFPPFLSSQMLNTGDADLMVLWFQLLFLVSSC